MYDLGCTTFMAGKLNHIQTLKRFHIYAGDRFSMDFEGVFRFQPLRQFIARDARVDVAVFFVPHRHVYGQTWLDYIDAGPDGGVSLPAANNAAQSVAYLAQPIRSGILPLRLIAGYNQIINRWYKNPSDPNFLVEADPLQGAEERIYGRKAARLPTVWSTGIDSIVTNADREVSSATVVDIGELAEVSAAYKTKEKDEWFARFYTDQLRQRFGGRASVDADQRPTLIWLEQSWLSGRDVDVTDSAGAGDYVGKSSGKMRFRMPTRYFGEHGMLWVLCVIRYPEVNALEHHYLDLKISPTYEEMTCDPAILSAMRPREHVASDFFAGGGSQSYGTFPDAQWTRMEPSVVHANFQQIGNFTFTSEIPVDVSAARYATDNELDNAFKDLQIGHWTLQGGCYGYAERNAPDSAVSMFVGANIR